MNRHAFPWKTLLLSIALSAAPVAFSEGLRWAMGAPFSWQGLTARWAFFVTVLLAARWIAPVPSDQTRPVLPWTGMVVATGGLIVILVYTLSGGTWAAWAALGSLYILLLGLDSLLASGKGLLCRLGVHVVLALAGGALLAASAQVESSFADEEFFVALQALALSAFSFLLLVAWDLFTRWRPISARQGLPVRRRWLILLLVLLAIAGLGLMVGAYQRSFFPLQAPAYDNISAETPYICGEVPTATETFDGEAVFQHLLERVEAHPEKEPPEYGMLALSTGEHDWAEAFRDSLLAEANKGRFTEPANSIKWGQHEAALRAYYLPRINAEFPGLFSDDELALLAGWFSAINRRAMTVEWVDWMYGLALSKWPEGPYENQENGAGLLALLESEQLGDPALSPDNREFLDRSQRGWEARFRNTDDAFAYQSEWITNAYLQSFYMGEPPEGNVQRSFEWLLLQALPDGASPWYNQHGRSSLAGAGYLAAQMLQAPRYLWLAERALIDLDERGKPLSAQPGVEQPISLTGRSPEVGSCLLYGDSGLPNQIGPLAPDKIVFRDGWSEDSAYLLLNLRFTGWHRYKATNAIPLLYQNGPIVMDRMQGERFRWLPEGRSLFRDKRIPRENLNGLVIERSGMSAAVYDLTGIGGPWAQDPPYYADVISFETGKELDISHTRLENWRGWDQDRRIYFYHQGGPIVVVDEAQGPSGQHAALTWHVTDEPILEGQRVELRREGQPVELLVLPLIGEAQFEMTVEPGKEASPSRLIFSQADGRLDAATVFLFGPWVGARVEIDPGSKTLQIRQNQWHIDLPLGMDQ